MNTPYHKIDSRILEYDIDSVEFKFGMWITKKEFGQRLNQNKPLPKGQFFMSVRVVAKDIEITEMIARRLIAGEIYNSCTIVVDGEDDNISIKVK